MPKNQSKQHLARFVAWARLVVATPGVRLVVVLLAVGTVLLPTPLAAVAWLFFMAAPVIACKRCGSRSYLWAYLVFFCLVIVLYAIAWTVHLPLAPQVVLLVTALASWVVSIWLMCMPAAIPSECTVAAWPGVIVALLVCLYVVLPVFQMPLAGSMVRIAARSGDDISHVGLIEADRRAGGYIYDANTSAAQLVESKFIGYPQGWHVNGAFVESLIVRFVGSDGIVSRLASYLLYKVGWLFLATFFIYDLSMTVMGDYFRLRGVIFTAMAAVTALVLSLGLLVSVYGYGFQNFIASIALVCAAICLVLRCANTENAQVQRWCVWGLLLLAVAAAYVWVLPGVTVGMLALATILKLYGANRVTLTVWIWPALAVAGLFALMQAYATQHGSRASAASSLLAGGAAPSISAVGVFIMYTVLTILVLRMPARRRWWLLVIVGLSIFEFAVLVPYQLLAVGELRYYAIKLAYLSAIVGAVLLVAVVASMVRLTRWPRYSQLVLCTALVTLLPLVLGLDPRKAAYPLKQSAPITTATAQALLALPIGNPNEVIRTPNLEESYLATRLWSDLRPYSSSTREALLDQMSQALVPQTLSR